MSCKKEKKEKTEAGPFFPVTAQAVWSTPGLGSMVPLLRPRSAGNRPHYGRSTLLLWCCGGHTAY